MKKINVGLVNIINTFLLIVDALLYLLLSVYPLVLTYIGADAAVNGSNKGICNVVTVYGLEAAINEIWLVAGFIYFPITVIWCFFVFVAVALSIYIVVSSIIVSAAIKSKNKYI